MSKSSSRKLVVEVCHAHGLMPKDGEGSSSPFVEVDFDGQRQRTKTKMKDLNPTWNEKLVFNVNDPSNMADEIIDVNVYNDKKTNIRNFLGKVRIPGGSVVKQGGEAVVPYTLEKRGLFSHIKGELFLKLYYYDEAGSKQGDKTKDENKKMMHIDQHQHQHQQQQMEKKQFADDKESIKFHNSGGRNMAQAQPTDYSLKETNPHLGSGFGEKVSTYDLVEQMEYLYVKVVKARNLQAKDITGSSDPYASVKVGNQVAKTKVVDKSLNPEWNQVFAFSKDKFQAAMVEITVKDKDTFKDDFLGHVSFDIAEVPTRVQPDSPLAPQWYKLEGKSKTANVGEIMVAVWKGTQGDEAFPEAWQSDAGGYVNAKAKVYLSPRLWYVRVNIIEAQDLAVSRFPPEIYVKVQLGFQTSKTRPAANRSSSPFWNEDLMLVAAEPFEDQLLLTVEEKVSAGKDEVLGKVQVPVAGLERRLDHRLVASRWFNLEKSGGGGGGGGKKDGGNSNKFASRIHVRLCLDGGYHVLDESTHYSSDLRPTAKQLWKPPVGVLELGILGATSLHPSKTKDGRSTTDAYCVAKYGQKWVRSRTIVDSLNPRWNEQYTWEVHDLCTVITIGVFDNCHLDNGGNKQDPRIGKVRIRLSTLESQRVYTHSYPLLVVQQAGLRKVGELELAVRFSAVSVINTFGSYAQPLLPKMHYRHPFSVSQLESLREAAMRMVALRLNRAEPPLRQEVVHYMLDVEHTFFSMRRSKANWFRIVNVISAPVAVSRWFSDICRWKNPVTTSLVTTLFLTLAFFPHLILPTIFLYLFLIGAWNFRFRPRHPPHMDPRLSHADAALPDELDEEFDTIHTSKSHEIVKARYDRLRGVAGRIQTVLGDLATQGERFQALLSWRDPRATAIFILFCLFAAILLYVTPFRVLAILGVLYVLRHPRFRNNMPSVPMNFFRRLPALSDTML